MFVCSPAKQRRSYNPDAKIVVTKTLRSGSKCFVSVCYSLRPHVGKDRSGWLHVQKLMEGRKKPETFTRFCMPTFNILLPSLPSRKNRVLVWIKVWNRIKKIQNEHELKDRVTLSEKKPLIGFSATRDQGGMLVSVIVTPDQRWEVIITSLTDSHRACLRQEWKA